MFRIEIEIYQAEQNANMMASTAGNDDPARFFILPPALEKEDDELPLPLVLDDMTALLVVVAPEPPESLESPESPESPEEPEPEPPPVHVDMWPPEQSGYSSPHIPAFAHCQNCPFAEQ